MNLKDFRKTRDDEQCAVFTNKRGHEFKIAKKALSKKLLNDLGKVPLHRAEGGDVVDEEPSLNESLASLETSGASPTGIPLASARDASVPAMATPKQAPQVQAPMQAPQQMQMPMQAQPQQLSPQDLYKKGYNETFAKHAEEFGKQAALWGQDLANGHVTPKTYADLFADKSVLGKAGTIFGLLLSGAGSGLAHQENVVLKMMQKEIENDLEAQKSSKTNAMNYYKANLEQQRTKAQVGLSASQARKFDLDSEATAIANTKNQMGLAYLQRITSLNQNLSPDKKAVGDQIINGVVAPAVDSYIRNNNAQAAKTLTESEFQQQNEDLRNAEMFGVLPGGSAKAKMNEERHYPGIAGSASRALTPSDNDYINSGLSFEKQLNNFMEWARTHSGDLSPSDIKTGKTLAAELQGAYRQATNGGVYKEGEQNFISSIIDSDPTKFFNEIRVLPQLEVVSKEHKRRLHTKIKGLGMEGLPGYKETKWVGGVEYEEGPDGYAVPVGKRK